MISLKCLGVTLGILSRVPGIGVKSVFNFMHISSFDIKLGSVHLSD